MQGALQEISRLGTQVSWRLRQAPEAVGLARRAVADLWSRWGLSGAQVPMLLTGEVVTNALKYSSSAIGLSMTRLADGRVLVEVSDASSAPPVLRQPGKDSEGGRGLMLLERLSQSWGYRPTAGGKAVWFVLAPVTDSPDAARGAAV